MTGHNDFDRTLADWFEADAISPAPAGALDRVLGATRRRRSRPAWLAGPGSHWVGNADTAGSSSAARLAPRSSTVIILLVVIAVLVGGAILVGARLFQPAPLPPGRLGHLAYGLNGDIYVADWDGKNPVRIADGLPSDSPPDGQGFWGEGPMWSPDGRHLAYRSGGGPVGCCGTVYVSDPSGHVVASFPGTGWLVSWSPDSTRVATWVELWKTIGIYGLDGVRQALLTLPSGLAPTGDYDPLWSPDGRSVLMRLGPPSPSAVWELPIDGGAARRVPDQDPRAHFDAVYSRDGTRVAFVPYLDSFSLVIAEANGTALRVLAGAANGPRGPGDGEYYEKPVWSPRGDQIAYTWSRGPFHDQVGRPCPRTCELRVFNVATGAVTSLASADGTEPFRAVKFSPDGDRVLFLRADANRRTSLWSVHSDGSYAQLLVPGTDWGDWQPLPVGAQVVQPSPLATDRPGHLAYGLDGDMYVAELDGSNPVRIADGLPAGGPVSCPSFWGEGTIWSPDGRHLAYRSCGTVFISDPAGHAIVSFPGDGWRVSWSPDSTRIATWVGGVSQTIGIYGLDGVRQALLTLPTGFSPSGDFDPEWSPDGASLLIKLAPPPPSLSELTKVWELPVEGGTPRPVPANDPRSRQATYSPDAARVAYFDSTAGTLVVAAADGSQDRVLISGGVAGGFAVWSPTGDRIAFDGGPLPAQELSVVDVASGTVTSVANTFGTDPLHGTDSLHVIRFSPSGDRILYSRWDANNVTYLWSVRADGSDPQLLVTGTNWGDWQPLPAGP